MREERERLKRELGVSCLACRDEGRYQGVAGEWVTCGCAAGEPFRERAAEVWRARWLERVPEELGLPARYRGATLGTFPDQDAPALAAVRRWVETADGSNLLLVGPLGRGKTGLAIGALRAMVEREVGGSRWPGAIGRIVTATGLLEELRPGSDRDTRLALGRLSSIPYLAVDDLGVERLTEWGAERLYEVVNARHAALLVTIVTSNLEPDKLAERINRQVGDVAGDRIVERLVEGARVVRFSGKDRNWRLSHGR